MGNGFQIFESTSEEVEVLKHGDTFTIASTISFADFFERLSVAAIDDVFLLQFSGGSVGSLEILAKVKSITYSKAGFKVICSSEDVKVKGKSAKNLRENGKKIKEGKYSRVAMIHVHSEEMHVHSEEMHVPSEEASKKGKEILCLIKARNVKKTKDAGTYKVNNKCTQLVLKDGIIESLSVAYTELVSDNEEVEALLFVNGKTYACNVREELLSEDSYECTEAINNAEKDEFVVLRKSTGRCRKMLSLY